MLGSRKSEDHPGAVTGKPKRGTADLRGIEAVGGEPGATQRVGRRGAHGRVRAEQGGRPRQPFDEVGMILERARENPGIARELSGGSGRVLRPPLAGGFHCSTGQVAARSRSAKKSEPRGTSPARRAENAAARVLAPRIKRFWIVLMKKASTPDEAGRGLSHARAGHGGRPARVRWTARGDQSIFLIFSVGVSTSLSSFFSQVPVTSTLTGRPWWPSRCPGLVDFAEVLLLVR